MIRNITEAATTEYANVTCELLEWFNKTATAASHAPMSPSLYQCEIVKPIDTHRGKKEIRSKLHEQLSVIETGLQVIVRLYQRFWLPT